MEKDIIDMEKLYKEISEMNKYFGLRKLKNTEIDLIVSNFQKFRTMKETREFINGLNALKKLRGV